MPSCFLQRTAKTAAHPLLLLLLLISSAQVSKGHFLWQQTVKDDSKAESTLFTFAELPGISNVDSEKGEAMASMAFDKGVGVYMNSITGDTSEQGLETSLNGKYITAKLPDDLLAEMINTSVGVSTKKKSYVLESFLNWGIFQEGTDASPVLLHYYTSAHYLANDNDGELDNLLNTAKNTFLLFMKHHHTHHSPDHICDGNRDHQSYCVRAIVEYAGDPVPIGTNITLFDGDTGEKIDVIHTDEYGEAFKAVPKTAKRLFGLVNYNIDEKGQKDGEDYDKISNWATSVLEMFASKIAPNPLTPAFVDESTSFDGSKSGKFSKSSKSGDFSKSSKSSKSTSSSSSTTAAAITPENQKQHSLSSTNNKMSTGTMVGSFAFVAFLAFLGSFLGGFTTTWLRNRRSGNTTTNNKREYQVISAPAEESLNLRLRDEAEPC